MSALISVVTKLLVTALLLVLATVLLWQAWRVWFNRTLVLASFDHGAYTLDVTITLRSKQSTKIDSAPLSIHRPEQKAMHLGTGSMMIAPRQSSSPDTEGERAGCPGRHLTFVLPKTSCAGVRH